MHAQQSRQPLRNALQVLVHARPYRGGSSLRRVRRAVDGGECNLDRRRTRRAVARCAGVPGHGEEVPIHRGEGAERLLSAQGRMTMDGMRCGRRNWWGKGRLGRFCALTALAAQAAEAVPDTDIWLKVRESFFGARPIRNDADGVIRLEAPYRAQDAATVPVAIRAGIAQTSERYIRTVYLIVDRNPSPIAAIFHFTPDSGRAEIETRIRIEEYTPVRAIAEMSDGELYVSAKFVKAAGGCSAPAGKDPEAALARLGRMKFHLDQSVVLGEPNLAQLMISHPNHSGLAMDQMTHL